MFNVRLAGGHLYGKQPFTWLSLAMSFMASFVLSFFPLDVLDGTWDLIESVSAGFLTYSFNSTSRYLDDLLNIDNNFFDSMVNRIYPSELKLNKANVSDAEASILDLHLSISDAFVKFKIYDKRDDFDFDIVNFPFLDGDVPRSAS